MTDPLTVIRELIAQMCRSLLKSNGGMRNLREVLEIARSTTRDITALIRSCSYEFFTLLVSSIVEADLCASLVFALDHVEAIENGDLDPGLYRSLYEVLHLHPQVCRIIYSGNDVYNVGPLAPTVKELQYDTEYRGKGN